MLLIRTLLFTVFVPVTVTVLIPSWLLSSRSAQSFGGMGVLRYVGMAPLIVGAAMYLWCAWDFAMAGRGTPAPFDAPKQLVVRGLYRYVRNPMYIGVLSVLLGEVLLFESLALLVYTAVVFCCFYLFVVFYEEPTLRQTFGQSYKRYCESVPRWLPRPMRSKAE